MFQSAGIATILQRPRGTEDGAELGQETRAHDSEPRQKRRESREASAEDGGTEVDISPKLSLREVDCFFRGVSECGQG